MEELCASCSGTLEYTTMVDDASLDLQWQAQGLDTLDFLRK